ncbi:MAG: tetratricopeptide repeat protein [Oscillospiraceae bacterium]|nr:tetratricopeptide repeat protein [Oscillospiraceae bacterium]
MEQRDFFISYNKADKEWAKWIAGTLETHGYTAYVQAWDIRPGDSFIDKMDAFLTEASIFVPVFSRDYFNSIYCNAEWKPAFNKYLNAKSKERTFIPVRIDDVEPEGLLSDVVYIDLCKVHDEKVAEKKLLQGVDQGSIPRKRPVYPGALGKEKQKFPGGLLMNNLPTRNLQFSGREDELSKIRKAFADDKSAVCIKQTIAGLGGVGKTQIALEYAHRSKNEYTDATWWMVAENTVQARDEFLKFAEAAGLLPEGMETAQQLKDDEIIRRLNGWFDAHHSFLLVFDNVEDAGDIAPYLSHTMTGHILVTTRDRSLNLQDAESLELGVYTSLEAVAFMRKCLTDTAAIDNETSLDLLTHRLGYLPLALKQAAAYMKVKANHCNCTGYLDLLDENGLEVFEDSALTEYRNIVTTTWKVSIEKTIPPARQLLNLCAYMVPDNILIEFFKKQRETWPEPLQSMLNGTMNINKVIRGLTRYALAERDEDGLLHIHRLVQEVVRSDAQKSDTDWLGLCLEAMIAAMPGLDDYGRHGSRDWFEQLAPHAAEIASRAAKTYENNEDIEKQTAFLCYLLGIGNRALARYSQALIWHQKESVICENVFGMEHPNTANSYGNIAGFYDNQGDYPTALEWHQKALIIREKVLGTKHPDTATTYNNIAGVYYHQGDYPKALKWYMKALHIDEKVLGKEHPDTATTYNNIASVYDNLKDYPKALDWYQKALIIKEKVHGKEHPDTAITYNNIAFTCANQGNYPAAIEWYQKALPIYEKVMGKEHPDTATTYNNIAGVYYEQGDYPMALDWFIKCYMIIKQVLGDAHPHTKATRKNMEAAYNKSRLKEPFEQWLQNLLKKCKRHL